VTRQRPDGAVAVRVSRRSPITPPGPSFVLRALNLIDKTSCDVARQLATQLLGDL
jgi:hypothetical protein